MRVNGKYDLVKTSNGTNERRLSSLSSCPWRLASPRRATHCVRSRTGPVARRGTRGSRALVPCRLAAQGGQAGSVVFGGEEVELSEVLDHGLLHRALEGEVELLQRFTSGEPGGLDSPLTAVALAGGDLGASGLGEPFIAPGPSRARSASAGSARAAAGGALEQVRELAAERLSLHCHQRFGDLLGVLGAPSNPNAACAPRRAAGRY